ncbi:MAG: polymer-forming cytoskeletal protein [Pseudomonadota bacterium]
MSDLDKGVGGQASCAYFGEGVVFKGSINAPEKVVVHGTVDGEIVARDLLVGPTGTIKGKVSVDQADVQGKVYEHIEAKVCLSLRKTGRIEGSATYGDIEIEKGGVLSGDVSTIKGSSSTLQQSPPKVQGNLPLPPQVVSSNPNPTEKTNVESNKLSVAGGQGGRPPLFNPDNKK